MRVLYMKVLLTATKSAVKWDENYSWCLIPRIYISNQTSVQQNSSQFAVCYNISVARKRWKITRKKDERKPVAIAAFVTFDHPAWHQTRHPEHKQSTTKYMILAKFLLLTPSEPLSWASSFVTGVCVWDVGGNERISGRTGHIAPTRWQQYRQGLL